MPTTALSPSSGSRKPTERTSPETSVSVPRTCSSPPGSTTATRKMAERLRPARTGCDSMVRILPTGPPTRNGGLPSVVGAVAQQQEGTENLLDGGAEDVAAQLVADGEVLRREPEHLVGAE